MFNLGLAQKPNTSHTDPIFLPFLPNLCGIHMAKLAKEIYCLNVKKKKCMTFLTFSESKQAITLPFSTWQLFGGCANLHSSSLREHVPL